MNADAPSAARRNWNQGAEGCHVIVLGNEKGGTGKSTIAMHLIVSLLYEGLRVGTIDLDARQGTLTRYVENRERLCEQLNVDLPRPAHVPIKVSEDKDKDLRTLLRAVNQHTKTCDVMVIDTAGSDNYLSRAGHVFADTLITPLNDSFIDLDVIARVDPNTMKIAGPSHYAESIWETRKNRALKDGGSVDWIVIRNRLSHLDSRIKRQMEDLVGQLSTRIGFRTAPGLGERVIYRELFLQGLTLLDLRHSGIEVEMSMSHVAARQELRALLDAINIKQLAQRSA
ncbi:ATPase involved in chromosome partitioning [Caenispirillum salinarum AK4]|uniref:ATPase involved in chromosome partitioning n=1 Tax=Caenispirillum salinarum AK4 TaxID=1238182 RepID=K9HNE8_9PROT|nr:division plane positioning ATPase MipZ [Caenispirillum salinarum]EKV30036.1 ATPase involved in chromosome partitioning [Caenispirillum salinarum AK4]